MSNVVVAIGAGWIGQALARRVSAGKRVLLADLRRSGGRGAEQCRIRGERRDYRRVVA
jgi:nucleoside-diphosphate-sugar epimerase